jgi:hypothetical protein
VSLDHEVFPSEDEIQVQLIRLRKLYIYIELLLD